MDFNAKKLILLETMKSPSINEVINLGIQKMLRENYSLEVAIRPNLLGYDVELYDRENRKRIAISPINVTRTYDEALEIGLKAALEMTEVS